jgi:cobalt-zinc-cadmium efflux system outer membrane protein
LLAEARAARPDVQSARRAEAAADTETQLQRALRTPNITAGGGYRRQEGSNAVVFSVTVPIPLFNQNQGGIARADAERRAAAARVSAAETTARLDVQQALNAVETNRARVAYIEREYLNTARETRNIVLESYRVGAADLIDFLDAQRAFRDTLRTYNRALYDARVSQFEFTAALGQSDPQK